MDEQQATVKSVSAMSGIKEDEIYDCLRTRAMPKEEMTRKLARALGVAVHSLDPPPPPIKHYQPTRPRGPGPPTTRLLAKSAVRMPIPAARAGTPAQESPLARADRRQKALILLLADKGIFTRDEWEAKIAEVISRRPRRSS